MNRSPAITELLDGPGFVFAPPVEDPEASWLRDFVEKKWRDRMMARHPGLADIILSTPISRYHEIAALIDHTSAWSKDSRLFSAAEVSSLDSHLSVFRFLRDAFGEYEIVDFEGLGHAEVVWRLVRPAQPSDVAAAHADSWFFTLADGIAAAEQRNLIKVWLPVVSEPGVSGLSVAVGSQKLNLSYDGEMRYGRVKPRMTDPRGADIIMTALALNPGQAVAFHPNLVHQGISHKTGPTRVSIEFAIRVPAPLQ